MGWDRATAAHVYRRVGFGATRATLEQATGIDAVLSDLLERRQHDSLLTRGVDKLMALEEIEQLQAWWMSLILRDRAPLVERVALMWHDHFATSHDKVGDVRLMHGQVQLFREQGLGDFRELMHAVGKDPAMLVWLDGNANRKGHPNENFAREVLELFGLGIGNYTERDIREAARGLSGWGVKGRQFVFRGQYHDEGLKDVLGSRGNFSGEDVIDLVLAHPACARHVARKLLEEFAVPTPTDEQVTTWSEVLVGQDWNIERTLEQLLRSELFLGPTSRRARISGPVEMLAITLINLGGSRAVAPRKLARAATEMGQALYRPPSVKGWDGGRAWIHAGTWLARHNHLTDLAREHGDEFDFTSGISESATEMPDLVLAQLLPDGASDELVALARRAAEEADEHREALRRIVALVLTAPEYHLV
ncbi:MAG: DUF1800 domain-containing protein [Planctomycetota bacterium]|nr:DUF1800 domain-containing protein [Planctomycetota bacterium]